MCTRFHAFSRPEARGWHLKACIPSAAAGHYFPTFAAAQHAQGKLASFLGCTSTAEHTPQGCAIPASVCPHQVEPCPHVNNRCPTSCKRGAAGGGGCGWQPDCVGAGHRDSCQVLLQRTPTAGQVGRHQCRGSHCSQACQQWLQMHTAMVRCEQRTQAAGILLTHRRPHPTLPRAPSACSTFPVVGFTSLGKPAMYRATGRFRCMLLADAPPRNTPTSKHCVPCRLGGAGLLPGGLCLLPAGHAHATVSSRPRK